MVARLSELPAPWLADALLAPGRIETFAGSTPLKPLNKGELMAQRASSLKGISVGGRGIPEFSGIALRLDEKYRRYVRDFFIRGSVFAVIGSEGDVCVRLPKIITEDLVENGLAIKLGKNLVTWPANTNHQLEINWRVLLQTYCHITGLPEKRKRFLWSEHVSKRSDTYIW